MTPSLVKIVAKRLPRSDVVDRLLIDERMEAVWRELARQTPNGRLVDNLLLWVEGDTPLGLTRDDIATYSTQERAAAAFFMKIVDALTNSPSLKTRAEHDAKARRLADAADLCREQAQRIDDDLKRALEKVGSFFAHQAELNEAHGDDPHIIDRRVGDDVTRVQARLIAAWSFSFYGRRNLGTIATILSVATGAEIRKPHVVKWTAKKVPGKNH